METVRVDVDVDQETLDKLKKEFANLSFEVWCGQIMMLELYRRLCAEEKKDGDV